MKFDKDKPFWKRTIVVCVALIVVFAVIMGILVAVFQTDDASLALQIAAFLVLILLIAAAAVIVAKVTSILDTLAINRNQFDAIADTLEKIRTLAARTDHNTQLSETAKSIASRDADRQSLRGAVFDKLQQKDFTAAYEIIDEISRSSIYQDVAKQLRSEADKFRHASAQEQINQIISQIENLLGNCQWAKASILIERLIKAEPDSDKARAMRQRLVDKKDERKKALLNTWDDAVNRQDTDRSLEILRELDLYLTPNEALALQEAAKDVFRSKLHSLGVQVALAISEKQWANAIQAGQQIIHDFPNSRMAEEIREKMDILVQKAKEQNG